MQQSDCVHNLSIVFYVIVARSSAGQRKYRNTKINVKNGEYLTINK